MKHYRLTKNAFVDGVYYKAGDMIAYAGAPGPHMIPEIEAAEVEATEADAVAADAVEVDAVEAEVTEVKTVEVEAVEVEAAPQASKATSSSKKTGAPK